MFAQLLAFFADGGHWVGADGIPLRLGEHLLYTLLALACAFVIAFPLGLLIGHTNRGAFLAINIGNAARAIPTLGLLTLLVLLLTVGLLPALVALIVLAIPPILTSTYAGIRNVEPDIVDASRGMGMTERQVLFRAELPAALPIIMGGLRTATLQVVSTATVAAYVSLGGLGRFLVDGLAQREYPTMFAGAVLVAALAIVLDVLFIGLRAAVQAGGRTPRTNSTPKRRATAS